MGGVPTFDRRYCCDQSDICVAFLLIFDGVEIHHASLPAGICPRVGLYGEQAPTTDSTEFTGLVASSLGATARPSTAIFANTRRLCNTGQHTTCTNVPTLNPRRRLRGTKSPRQFDVHLTWTLEPGRVHSERPRRYRKAGQQRRRPPGNRPFRDIPGKW